MFHQKSALWVRAGVAAVLLCSAGRAEPERAPASSLAAAEPARLEDPDPADCMYRLTEYMKCVAERGVWACVLPADCLGAPGSASGAASQRFLDALASWRPAQSRGDLAAEVARLMAAAPGLFGAATTAPE